MNSYLKSVLLLLIVFVASFMAHYLVLSGMQLGLYWSQTSYSLLGMYGFGLCSSLLVAVLVFFASWSMPEKLGVLFLGLVLLKAVAAFIYIKDGLNTFENDFIEYNFLVVFFISLFVDVYIAFNALNQADKKV
ncbi:hypothetical protein ABTW24_13895 [Sphingobacterium thalpophilum]|uniref:Uncharacterized protein n=1 Tax=Sphingobacterium thalpophilum TaxID=259 RepID=A0A4U9V2B6_9SPHI|nr:MULTISPECIES: hypothetical protein [Sphingobacterium]MCW8312685.1 hypothetical protein [Sphingobacterium sp. InxBP1]VTR40605.1 Uncharacterised protein [Sphingobacterium thalpophilum]